MWNLIKTAKWMGVEPWKLANKPLFWREWGQACMEADDALELEREKHRAGKRGST